MPGLRQLRDTENSGLNRLINWEGRGNLLLKIQEEKSKRQQLLTSLNMKFCAVRKGRVLRRALAGESQGLLPKGLVTPALINQEEEEISSDRGNWGDSTGASILRHNTDKPNLDADARVETVCLSKQGENRVLTSSQTIAQKNKVRGEICGKSRGGRPFRRRGREGLAGANPDIRSTR